MNLKKYTLTNAILFFILSQAPSAFALSPPWYILQSQFNATLGADPCLRVDPLKVASQSPLLYDLNIHDKCGSSKAQGLAPFVSRNHTFGNITVTVQVFDRAGNLEPGTPPSTPEIAESDLQQALQGNPYFVKIVQGNRPITLEDLYVVFTADVIQYYTDDISDLYGNTNEVAAHEFRDVLGFNFLNGILISASTDKIEDNHPTFQAD